MLLQKHTPVIFGNLTISIICQKTKTLIYLIYDNSDINVKCLVPVNDPLPQSPSSCDPPYCLPLTCLSSPLWVPLLLWSFLPHTRHCQPAILFISLFFISTWKQIHFFFLILSQWLINLWNWNAMIFKTWRTHSF